MTPIDELPDDPAVLKRLLSAERAERHTAIDEAMRVQMQALCQQMEAEQKAAIDEAVKAAVAAILRRYYGPRSETFDPRQLLLFGQQVEQLPLDVASVADEAGEPLVTRRVKRRDQHGRQQLPEHLERIEIDHDLPEHEKACPACGGERCRIGAEVSEQLEYFPASFKVLKHVRHKYACGKCNADGYNPNIVAAAKPPQPIDKGLPGPSLLAYVITSKLGDHLPLYRNRPTNRTVPRPRSAGRAATGGGMLAQPIVW
jgi:transposase